MTDIIISAPLISFINHDYWLLKNYKQRLLIWYIVIIDLIIFRSILIDNNAKINKNSNSEFYFFTWYENI